jgi:hypothetical protein
MRAVAPTTQPGARASSSATRRIRRRPAALALTDGRASPPPPLVARATSSSAAASVPSWLDNSHAQSAAALDVEYAHYELFDEEDDSKPKRQRRPASSISVPAAVAVVARVDDEEPTTTTSLKDWRSGLQVLYYVAYIEPELPDDEQQQSKLWRWVGGVRRPASALSERIMLADAREQVLSSLTDRQCIILHGVDHDLRALGLVQLPQTKAVVLDTAALPPLTHPRSGGPVSLKRLARRFLQREIQVEGELHDPIEDAAATLDLWLDVAWPRALVDRQVANGHGGDGDAENASLMLVEALEAKMRREVVQGRGAVRRS